MGTKREYFKVMAKDSHSIAKDFAKQNASMSQKDFESLIYDLTHASSHNEHSFAGNLLQYMPEHRKHINLICLNSWLEKAHGWGEVDALCQSTFTAEEILNNWQTWKSLLTKFSKDQNIHKRRASLVILTKPVRHSDNKRLTDLAFNLINRLKHEKDVLITKAISWLLRDLIVNNRDQVVRYLKANADAIPKIALREVSNKLLTGKK